MANNPVGLEELRLSRSVSGLAQQHRCGSQKQAQWPKGPWSHEVPPSAPRALSHTSSQTEVLPRIPSSCAVTAAGASLPCVAYISWYLIQIPFCSDFKYFRSLELPGDALENKNFAAWAPSWKFDFVSVGRSSDVSILSVGIGMRTPDTDGHHHECLVRPTPRAGPPGLQTALSLALAELQEQLDSLSRDLKCVSQASVQQLRPKFPTGREGKASVCFPRAN